MDSSECAGPSSSGTTNSNNNVSSKKIGKSGRRQHRVNDSQSERAVQLRNSRQFRETYECHLWGSWRDVDDVFDLRYLFDDDEVLASKRQLIEDFDYYGQNSYYYNFYDYLLYYDHEDEDLDEQQREQGDGLQREQQEQPQQGNEQEFNFVIFNENLELIFGENDDLRLGGQLGQQPEEEEEEAWVDEEEENWDNEEYNVRFDMRLGFITDDYDSGYDEPNSRKEEYPPLEEDRMIIDDSIDEAQERLANMLVQLHLRHDLRPLVNS